MYKKCLIALDNSPFDEKIISQVEALSSQLPLKETICAHVVHLQEESEIPTASAFPERENQAPVDCRIPGGKLLKLKGQPETVLAECIKEQGVDLVCVGLKEQRSHIAQVGRRLLCMTDADVLFVSGGEPRTFKRILIPTDLSGKSYELVEHTLENFPEAEIQLFFVNYIPSKIVMAEEDRQSLMKEASANLDTSMKHFIENLKSPQKPVTFAYAMSEHFNAGFAINDYVMKSEFDAVAIGRLSKLDKELPFIGSVTEKILGLINNIPVLVINH